MKKQHLRLFMLFVLSVVLSGSLPRTALCGPDHRQAPGEAVIRGRDCQILKDFFERFEQDKTNRVPGGEVKQILLQALPEVYRKEWAEGMARTGAGTDGPACMTVRVLYVEGRKEEKPIRALIAFSTLLKTGEGSAAYYDERLGALVILRDEARLSLMEQEKDREGLQFVRISPEKEVRIGGHGVIGLDFAGSNENQISAGPAALLKEERVNFYVFQDGGIKPAGSVLKSREERLREGDSDVYSGAVIFKKDMKGNIIGILSPYTVTRDDRRIEKGMVRYVWDKEKETFVRE
jgi:hypothetical protein